MNLDLILYICIIFLILLTVNNLKLILLAVNNLRTIIEDAKSKIVNREIVKFEELMANLDIEIDSIEVGEGFTNRCAYLTDESKQQITKFFSETKLTKKEIKKYLL